MSSETEYYHDPSDAAVALFLLENDGEELTDILVAALNEALQILGKEISSETVH